MEPEIKNENKTMDSVNADAVKAVKKVTRKRRSPANEKSKSLEELYLKSRTRTRSGKKEKSSKKIFWVAGTILIIILVVGGAFAAIKLKGNLGSRVAVPEPSAQPEPIPEPIVVEEPKEEPAKIDIATLNVKALNAGASAGLAGKVKTALVTQGYAKAEAGNGTAEGVVGNFVYYSEDKFQEEAGKISEFLATRNIKAEVMAAKTEEQKSADVVVILGK